MTSNGTTETATVSVTVTPVNDAPVAADFTFTGADGAIGNTSLVVNDPTDGAPDPAGPQRTVSGDILAGATDVDTALNLLTITAETITNASGSLVIQADGDFTYLPAAGFSGNAVFTYTLNDNDPLGNATDTGNITINVPASPRVWYVDPNAATNGDGTSDNPFNTLTQLNGLTGDGTTNDDVDGANDIIFIYGGTLSAGITLEDGQQLIGQSVGLTVSGTALEAATGSNPLINGAVVLASGNTIDGIDIGNASGFALSGTSIGTASFNHGSINNTTGGALSVTTGGTLNATFTNFSSSAGTNAVNLVGVNGTVNLGTGALSNASGTTFNVNGGAARHHLQRHHHRRRRPVGRGREPHRRHDRFQRCDQRRRRRRRLRHLADRQYGRDGPLRRRPHAVHGRQRGVRRHRRRDGRRDRVEQHGRDHDRDRAQRRQHDDPRG